MILYSVTIPAYKSTYLKQAIESVLVQTYTNFELIIVNDHSPEDLDSIVSQFNDPRIRYYVNEKNCGAENVVDNWNICLNYAKGEYIICMGDDDKLLPCCLEEYNKLIQQYPGLGVYHGWTEIINENSHVTKMQEPRPIFEGVYSSIWGRWNGRLQFIGDFLFDINHLKENGGFYKFPCAWGSDDITAFVAASYAGIANTQVPVFQYRVNSHTISNNGNPMPKMEATCLLHARYIEIFKTNLFPTINDEEVIFRDMCKGYLNTFILKKKVFEITNAMLSIGIIKGVMLFIKNRLKFNLSFMLIFYCCFNAFRRSNAYLNTKLHN